MSMFDSRYPWVSIVAAALAMGGCGGDDDGAPSDPDDVPLLRDCSDDYDTIYTRPADLPAYDRSQRGDVIRCGKLDTQTAAEATAQAQRLDYRGPALSSGMTIYRIAFRTERVPGPGGAIREGISSALLFVPSAPRGDGFTVVYAHPTIGLGAACAPSRQDVLGPRVEDYHQHFVPLLVLAGSGYTVIAPDYAGTGYGEQPGFALADDVSRSVLDASRAAAKVVPAAYRGTQVALAGHSLGGHAVLAAYAKVAEYGIEGELIGVAGFAPLWVSPYAFGGLTARAAGYTTADYPYLVQYSMDYLWTHAELLDGEGAGALLFRPEQREQIVDLLRDGCVTEVGETVPSLGTYPADFMVDEFTNDVGLCGITGSCESEQSATWAARFRADRPPIPANGPPVTLWFGGLDGTISPGFARCTMDKLAADVGDGTTVVRGCVEAESVHTEVPVYRIDWVSAWLGQLAFGDPAPPECPPPDMAVACTTPPPNL